MSQIQSAARKLLVLLALPLLMSCGTLLGGKLENCQKRKPGMDNREIRPWAFAGDMLLFPIALPIDFYTGGIYKPCGRNQVKLLPAKENRKMKP
jgi:hypothetical protein